MRNKHALEEALNSNDLRIITDTMLYIAHCADDLDWAEDIIMKMALCQNDNISGLALTCLGHLARVNQNINRNKVVPFLEGIMDKHVGIIAARAEDALDDINLFAK